MAMQDDLVKAAKDFREQLTAGLQPDVGAFVLLVHKEGIGLNSNIPREHLVAILEAAARQIKMGGVQNLILPVGRA